LPDLPAALGYGYSGNGDFLSFGRGLRERRAAIRADKSQRLRSFTRWLQEKIIGSTSRMVASQPTWPGWFRPRSVAAPGARR
jgi:hypothetical protein